MLRSPMRILFLLALAVLGPNLLWVARSSVVLRNDSGQPKAVRLVLADDPAQVVDAGILQPGDSRFFWIEPRGEATLSVELRRDDGWGRYCSEYVEAGMYRVEITLAPEDDVACTTSLPIFERLLVADVLG